MEQRWPWGQVRHPQTEGQTSRREHDLQSMKELHLHLLIRIDCAEKRVSKPTSNQHRSMNLPSGSARCVIQI
jgi:hypothetical protein